MVYVFVVNTPHCSHTLQVVASKVSVGHHRSHLVSNLHLITRFSWGNKKKRRHFNTLLFGTYRSSLSQKDKEE